jgi:hypothetical protein
MDELTLLHALLLVAMAVAPLGTHRFFLPEHTRALTGAHAVAWACAALGLFTTAHALTTAWLLFCAASSGLFLYARRAALLPLGPSSPGVLAACVPLLFSNVSAVWIVAGANDLHLLGYGALFSAYAALHGLVLGWMTVGAIAILAEREGPERRVYLGATFVCLVSFLAIALGIDRFRALEPVGIVGLSLALPIAQLVFLRRVRTGHRVAFLLGAVSFGGLVVTLALAWAHHLALLALPDVAGVRAMVALHGVLNTLVVAPCLLAAARLDAAAPPVTRAHVAGSAA